MEGTRESLQISFTIRRSSGLASIPSLGSGDRTFEGSSLQTTTVQTVHMMTGTMNLVHLGFENPPENGTSGF
jgi:hypothetical protein